MSIAGKNPLNRLITCLVTTLLSLTAVNFVFAPNCSNAQSSEKVRSLPGQFFPEENCPVNITETRTELDVDRFDAPIDARVYVTYTNVSQNPIVAVNFRVRLSDAEGHDLGTFRGGDGFLVNAGESRAQKFKHEGIDPHVTGMQIWVLQVKYAAGNIWESSKLQELQNSNGQAPGPDSGLPASMDSAPAQSLAVPVQIEAAPAQSLAAPVQIEAAPVQIEAAPVQSLAAPMQIEAAPAQSLAAPMQIEAAPAQSLAAPMQIEAAPAQSLAAPVQIEPVPATK